jgi:hypothetical protein
MHRLRPIDIEIALERYRTLTGDAGATLRRIGTEQIAFYLVDNSRYLEGFKAYGVRNAHTALTMFCDGYEAGFRRGQRAVMQRLELHLGGESSE